MPDRGEMTIAERHKYLQIQRGRYLAASRKGRSELLNEMQEVTGLHRKTLIRLMNHAMVRRPRLRLPGSLTHRPTRVAHVWKSMPCSINSCACQAQPQTKSKMACSLC